MSAAETVAVDVLRLDPRDRDAIAYFDPAKGAGGKLLPLVHTCTLVNMLFLRPVDLLLSVDEVETDKEDSGSEDEEMNLETRISTRTADILLATLLRMPKPSRAPHRLRDRVDRQASVLHGQSQLLWPRLVRIYLLWGGSIPRVYPLLARLARFTNLESFDLWISPRRASNDDMSDDDNDEDDAAAIEAASKTIQPVHTLQELIVTTFERKPELFEPVVNLLSPAAPLRAVSWLAPVPAGLFPRLLQGKKPLQRLTLGCLARPEQYVRKVWPQLRNLGTTRPIMNLCVDLPSNGDDRDDYDDFDSDDDEHDFPATLTIEEFLRDIPLSIPFAETTYTARNQDRDPYMFSIGSGPFFRAMFAGPQPLFLTIQEDGTVSQDWNDKTRAQTVMLSMRALGEDIGSFTTELTLARYREGSSKGRLSEWQMVSRDIVDKYGKIDPSAGPEAMVDLITRGLGIQPL